MKSKDLRLFIAAVSLIVVLFGTLITFKILNRVSESQVNTSNSTNSSVISTISASSSNTTLSCNFDTLIQRNDYHNLIISALPNGFVYYKNDTCDVDLSSEILSMVNTVVTGEHIYISDLEYIEYFDKNYLMLGVTGDNGKDINDGYLNLAKLVRIDLKTKDVEILDFFDNPYPVNIHILGISKQNEVIFEIYPYGAGCNDDNSCESFTTAMQYLCASRYNTLRSYNFDTGEEKIITDYCK